MTTRGAHDVRPLADYGFFGPDSVTWKVFSYPTSTSVGFQRTVAVEMLEPFLMASVSDTDAVMRRPRARYDRTLQYVATVAFGDTASVLKASDVLVRIHSRIVGREPISGGTYDANDPQAQLWIHLTQWHSVLYCYERFGPGPLSEQEDLRYWAECATAAEFQTIDPSDVPRNRAEMRAYYARMRPVLAATEVTQKHVDHLLDGGGYLVGEVAWFVRPAVAAVRLLARKATIATLPRWLRRMAGVRQGRVQDALVTALVRPVFRRLHHRPELSLRIVGHTSPSAAQVIGPALLGVRPVSTSVSTPTQARHLAGVRSPREIYAEQLATRGEVPQAAPRDDATALLSFGATL
jgi:uncharacterized protein (DUF2236 family)